MSYNIVQFLRDYNIDFSTKGKNISRNWIGVNCPSCGGDTGYHGAISPDGRRYNCWREGSLELAHIITLWLGVSKPEVYKLLAQYAGENSYILEAKRIQHADKIDLPGGALSDFHKKYLLQRNFDPEQLTTKYGFRGTGAFCQYKGQNFALSLIIPVFDRYGQLISFQARDITGKAPVRYRGLKEESSIKHYKDTLYNLQFAKGESIVLCEGVFDAIRGGDGFVCTFGTSLKTSQLLELRDYKKVYMLFDSEQAAQDKAFRYGRDLSSVGIEVENICLNLGERDLGDLSVEEIESLRKELNI